MLMLLKGLVLSSLTLCKAILKPRVQVYVNAQKLCLHVFFQGDGIIVLIGQRLKREEAFCTILSSGDQIPLPTF